MISSCSRGLDSIIRFTCMCASEALIVLIQASTSLIRSWATTVFGARFGFELNDRFVRALHSKPATFFLRHHTGDILNRSR